MVVKTLGLQHHFRTLRDPRRVNCCQHLLLDVIAIAICAVIANADDWQGVETFGHDRLDWLKTFLKLPNGIPSHDTFERIFDALDPQAFQQCLLNWFNALRGLPDLKQVAIDGKVLRGSGKGHGPLGALHLVNAWATEQGMHLGQVAVDADSNEITAVPKLLELLALEGALVTLNAMHCQKETAQKLRDGGGDYLLTVKGNQQQLRDEIERCADIRTGGSRCREGMEGFACDWPMLSGADNGREDDNGDGLFYWQSSIVGPPLWPGVAWALGHRE